jgi:hypothetical protein
MKEIEEYKIWLNSQRALFQAVCQLSKDQVDLLEMYCFKYATTRLEPNNKTVKFLMSHYYSEIVSGRKNYEFILREIQNALPESMNPEL